MLAFDPQQRITVPEALQHPWLASYHDVNDEPDCPVKFEKWRDIEKLETIDEFREALWNEIEGYRREVRSMNFSLSGQPLRSTSSPSLMRRPTGEPKHEGEEVLPPEVMVDAKPAKEDTTESEPQTLVVLPDGKPDDAEHALRPAFMRKDTLQPKCSTPTDMNNDPVVTYARRSSILHHHQHSATNSPLPRGYSGLPPYAEDTAAATLAMAGAGSQSIPEGLVPFPGSYIVPARSRTASTAGEFVPRKLLRTLSTVSIHESTEGLVGGLQGMGMGMGPLGKTIAEHVTGADAPASEMPRDFDIEEKSEGSEEGAKPGDLRAENPGTAAKDTSIQESPAKKKEKRFLLF